MSTAKLVGFQILLDKKGRLLVELSGLPLDEVDNVFKDYPNKNIYSVLIKECNHKLDELVTHLELELSSV
jgi:predicted transcriptional regulator